ncbi:protein mono-ADP-ribosyltransferase PARP14-like [Lates japonicus]
MDEYRHPLLFEAKELTDKEMKIIWRYFQKQRNSGGGDCGMIKKVGDNTYQICFKEKKVQESVLQKKEHIISLPCQEMHLTVTLSKSHNPESTDQTLATSQVS